MKIQYHSDLHLERNNNRVFFDNYKIKPIADILILAGDTTASTDKYYQRDFFDYLSENWKEVYMIPGNHEYYFIEEKDLLDKPYLNRKIRKNVHLLNNQSIVIDDLKIIFSTMWSPISIEKEFHIQDTLKDFMYIYYKDRLLRSSDMKDIFNKSFDYINSEVQNNKSEKLLIVTHHAPTKLVISQQYKTSKIQEAFSVELHPFIFDNDIDYWIYGHTHQNIDAEINGTKIVSNQFGYAESGVEIEYKLLKI